MKKFVAFTLLFSFLILSAATQTIAQNSNNENQYEKYKRLEDENKIRQNVEDSFRNLRKFENNDTNVYLPYYRPQKSSEIKAKLQINEEDIQSNKEFLKSSNTGIFKLLPFLDCSIAAQRENCARDNIDRGAFATAFSFREGEHTIISKADLSVLQNKLTTSKNAVQSILVDLGDIPLSEVDLETPGISFLFDFKPETSAKKINQQYSEIDKGIKNGGFLYTKSLPVEENTTFALRSIAYKNSAVSPGENADVITAFRIVRKTPDGEITILWKELSRKDGLKVKK